MRTTPAIILTEPHKHRHTGENRRLEIMFGWSEGHRQTMERRRTMAETILQINFKFEGSKAEYLKTFGEVAAPIAAR